MSTTKKCAGVAKIGRQSHEAPLSEFPRDRSTKDGYDRLCKGCNAAYAKAKRDAKSTPVVDDEQPTPRPPLTLINGESPGVAEARQELEVQLEAAGGVGTDEGQAVLEAKRARRNELQRARRAAAKATE